MSIKDLFSNLEQLLKLPDLSSKKTIYERYDSQIMGDTIQINSDAAIIKIHNTDKAIAITSDCIPRYVKSDPEIGGKQAVAETYRNISAVGATPLAITNCLNFGNPEKPEIMGQIVKAIKGINESCRYLDYPVISGNVSLYNETNGTPIFPTPVIGGVGLLKDFRKRCDSNLKNLDDIVCIVGDSKEDIGCSLFSVEILKNSLSPPPRINLKKEKINSIFIRQVINKNYIKSCHDISDGGLLVALFEMVNMNLGFKVDFSALNKIKNLNHFCFSEDQARYLISLAKHDLDKVKKVNPNINLTVIAEVVPDYIILQEEKVEIKRFKEMNKLSSILEN